jgi:hypothetical protein
MPDQQPRRWAVSVPTEQPTAGWRGGVGVLAPGARQADLEHVCLHPHKTPDLARQCAAGRMPQLYPQQQEPQ